MAIKVFRPELAAMLGPERFLREIRVAAQLTHPHILPIHDSGTAAGSPLLRHAVRRGRVAAGPARGGSHSSRSTRRCGIARAVADALEIRACAAE